MSAGSESAGSWRGREGARPVILNHVFDGRCMFKVPVPHSPNMGEHVKLKLFFCLFPSSCLPYAVWQNKTPNLPFPLLADATV